MRRRAGTVAGAVAAAVLTGSLTGPARAALTPDQRTEIVEVLRDALRSDPGILREAIDALQKDDAARQASATRDAITRQRQALVAQADFVAGNPDGDVTLVEFYDTRCPYCRAFMPTLAALIQADPHLRVVFKDLPVLGPNSVRESRGLIAAQRQGGYLQMQEAVMRSSAPLTEDGLQAAAVRIGLDGPRFARDQADPAITDRLDANLHLAQSLHMEGTPAFVVGDQVIAGSVPLAQLQQAVAAARAPSR